MAKKMVDPGEKMVVPVEEEATYTHKDLERLLNEHSNLVRKILEYHFRFMSGGKEPPENSKSAGELWWKPLRLVAEYADWNPYTGLLLLDEAFVRMEGATVKSPKSLMSTIDSIVAERRRRDTPGRSFTVSGYREQEPTELTEAEKRFIRLPPPEE